MGGKTLKKIPKKKIDADWERPVEYTVRVVFPNPVDGEKNRRVVPHDLHRAGAAAGAAIRTLLESLDIPYEIEDVQVTTRYSYVHSETTQHT